MARNATRSVVTRIYKVSAREKKLVKELKRPSETWYDCMRRIGEAVREIDVPQKEDRTHNLRLDIPAEMYETLLYKSEKSGFPMLTILIRAAEQLARNDG